MKFGLLALFLGISIANASEITVLDVLDSSLPNYNSTNTAIQINTLTNQGYIRLTASKEFNHVRCSGTREDRNCDLETESLQVYTKDIDVTGLTLDGDKLVYRGEAGAIECATLGTSRVFHVPTLYLTGNCQAKVMLKKIDGISRLQLNFVTK